MKFSVYQGSRQGPRPYNQDRLAYSYSKDAILLVIADGMGGHRHGEVAAQLAVKVLVENFQLQSESMKNPADFLHQNILDIHKTIDNIREKRGLLESPRTTIVAAIIQHDYLYAAHVGDSRLYHFRNKKIIYRTEDHSVVQMLYRKGQLDTQSMLIHPQRHKIYNCVGGDKVPDIELTIKHKLKDGDTLLLCTDGLWSAISDDEINQTLQNNPVNVSVPKMLESAETAAGKEGDNMSAIALEWGNKPDDKLSVSTMTMPLGATTTIMNPVTYQQTIRNDAGFDEPDLTDDEIERAISDIQNAIHKTGN
ncbi:phosphatase [Methylovorus sp. MM2]|uniref:PP2C family protein-serine/threonine phosphatase n=1 Tax=Methylovorus sp. MM2 TaxID=1848038 RepID=UPI0007DE6C94|nr:protein phosphatase 2C domain-containing protein [Methylovorus sp. MM2]OAM51941.1 phosphatase [Methylovorus sp. MM2]